MAGTGDATMRSPIATAPSGKPATPTITVRRLLIIVVAMCFGATWLLLLGYVVRDFQAALFTFGPQDVARRLTAPNGQKTALLVRDYHFDLNFRLYMIDTPTAFPPRTAQEALWSSQDYNPVTDHNWHEDLEWSADSALIAVRIDQQYVFAYDFTTEQQYVDPDRIRQLISLYDTRHTTAVEHVSPGKPVDWPPSNTPVQPIVSRTRSLALCARLQSL